MTEVFGGSVNCYEIHGMISPHDLCFFPFKYLQIVMSGVLKCLPCVAAHRTRSRSADTCMNQEEFSSVWGNVERNDEDFTSVSSVFTLKCIVYEETKWVWWFTLLCSRQSLRRLYATYRRLLKYKPFQISATSCFKRNYVDTFVL